MRIRRVDEQTVAIEELDLFCCELLRQIPLSAQYDDSPEATARLFPAPTRGADAEQDEEWKEYVAPELRELFQSHLDVVASDLKDFPPMKPKAPMVLMLPMKHLEAWVHALNQARIALSARYDFTEKDMDQQAPSKGDVRDLALFQVHFYGLLQDVFLRQLDDL